MGFCEASEERNTHDCCVARLGHPLTQALHDWKQESFPPGCIQTGVIGDNGVIGVYGDIGVNGVTGVNGGHWGQWVRRGLCGH